MKLTTVFTAVMATLATAAPAKKLVERDAFGIYLCTDAGFSGTCFHEPNLAAGACFNYVFPGGKHVNAVGPDQGMLCMIFDAPNCTGARYALLYPGSEDLADQGWKDRLESFYCVNLALATSRFVTPAGVYDNITVAKGLESPMKMAPPVYAEINE